MTTNQAKPSPSAEDEPPLQHEGHRILPTPFLTKTFQLVDDPSVDDIISWNEDGSTFVVWRPAEFAHDILPKYFKHNNFSSFVRQLNTYGFRKIVPDRWEFAHDCFRRGEKRLLCDIHRRKILSATAPSPNQVGTPVSSGDEQVVSTTTSPGGAPHPGLGSIGTSPDLAEENDRLRRENKQLSRELGEMRSVCSNIVQLMSKYSPCRRNGATVPDGGGEAASKTLPLDMQLGRSSAMDKDEEDTMNRTSMDTRLFGVSIGLKRNRGEESGVASRSALDVKQEPLDGVGQQ